MKEQPNKTANEKKECWSLEVFHCAAEHEGTAPLKARDYKDPLVVAYEDLSKGDGQPDGIGI